MADRREPDYHEDVRRFGDAIQFTASETGFSARLIEKDYYCSLILRELGPLFEAGLVFKGGTSLAKVHAGFYRLSEDLDFGVSMDSTARRNERRTVAGPIKSYLQNLSTHLDCVTASNIRGENESRQYRGTYSFRSQVTGQDETIKVEVSFREPAIEPAEFRSAQTLLVNPFTGKAAVPELAVKVLSLRETYAEKARAALSRREPAIRDFYDIQFAVQKGILNLADPELLALLRGKLAIAGNEPVDLSESRLFSLRQQVTSQLQPVLRPHDFASFDLDKPFTELTRLAKRLSSDA